MGSCESSHGAGDVEFDKHDYYEFRLLCMRGMVTHIEHEINFRKPFLVQYKNSELLRLAIEYNQFETALLFLNPLYGDGADIHALDNVAMKTALYRGNIRQVEFILQHSKPDGFTEYDFKYYRRVCTVKIDTCFEIDTLLVIHSES